DGHALSANAVTNVGADGVAVTSHAAMGSLEGHEESRRFLGPGGTKAPRVEGRDRGDWDEGAGLADRGHRISIKDGDIRWGEVVGTRGNVNRPVKCHGKTVDHGPAVCRRLIVKSEPVRGRRLNRTHG